MNDRQHFAEEAISGANPAAFAERLRALSARPQQLTVRDLIDRYMACYAGADTSRSQRLAAWSAMIGDFTLEKCDSDLVHAARSELAKQFGLGARRKRPEPPPAQPVAPARGRRKKAA